MQKIAPGPMKQAINFLYNRIVDGEKYKDGDLDRYAEIASFLTDETAFKAAMKRVETEMVSLFKQNPTDFEVAVTGGVYIRQAALGPKRREAGYEAQAKADLERNNGQRSILPQAKPKQPPKDFNEEARLAHNSGIQAAISKQTDVIRDREKQFLDNHPGYFIEDKEKDVVVRKFHFHRLLRAIEAKYKFVDNGLILMDDLDGPRFGHILSQGEVWKDSIAATHGEYTHRLQWLAVADHFRFSKEEVMRLYKGSSNQIRSKYSAYYDEKNLPNTKYASSLWNFLFDCFAKSADAPVIWDGTISPVALKADRSSKVLADDEVALLGILRACGRSDSFRSPLNVTDMLRTDATMGLLHAYLSSSQIKTPLIEGEKIGPLPAYRRDRLEKKYPEDYKKAVDTNPVAPKKLAMFVPPVSPSINVSQII
jgi:hypothetical protein